MRLPDWLARFNRHVTNPIQRTWAGKLPPWAIVEHRGRRSGRTYRTPVLAARTTAGGTTSAATSGFAIVLFYGPDRDWIKNLQAAGGGVLTRGGRRHHVSAPRIVQGDEATNALPSPLALLASAIDRQEVLLLRATSPAGDG